MAQEQTTGDGIEDWIAATMCAADERSVDLEQLSGLHLVAWLGIGKI
jgi:hypothetical protein